MDISDYWQLVRRNVALLLLLPALATVAGFVMADKKDRLYRSTASILLRPNDPTERQGSGGSGTEIVFGDRIVRASAQMVTGPAIRQRAAASIPNASLGEVAGATSVSSSSDSNVLYVSATTRSPDRSAEIANGVAAAFIEDRRLASVKGLESAMADIDEKIAGIQTELVQLSRLPDDSATEVLRTTGNAQFQRLSDRRLGLSIDKELKRGEAEMIATAEVPGAPISPKPLRSAALAGMLGLMAAGAIVLLKDRLDTRLRTREEAEDVSGLSTLAEIPFDKQAHKGTLLVASQTDPDGVVAEALRSLRVSLRFLALDQPLKLILVTSAVPGDGKSTISVNLAHSYAAAGMRTLLVSGDLRRPRVDRIVSVDNDAGLVELLTEMTATQETSRLMSRTTAGAGSARRLRASPDVEAYCHHETENLWILPAGQRVANPVEVLGSAVAKDFFAQCRDDFDAVIIDSPPLLAVADAVVLSQFVDGVIVVASLRKTHRDALARSVEVLANGQGRILGLALNRVGQDGGNGYGYGYSYGSPAAAKQRWFRRPLAGKRRGSNDSGRSRQ